MTNPLISVVIPAYNAETTIETALKSVLQQVYRPLEVIVVDDGSVDRTYFMVQRYIGLVDANIKIVLLKQDNTGPSGARNTGIKQARGDFIAFLDTDDVWTLRDKLNRQIALFKKDETLDLVFTNAITRKVHGEEMVMFQRRQLDKCFFGHEYRVLNPLEKLLQINFIPTSSVLIKKYCFNENMLFNEGRKYAEDWELWLKLSLNFRFGYITDVCVHKREYEKGLSMNKTAMVLSQLEIMEEFLTLYRKEVISLVGKSLLSKRLREFYRWSAYWLMTNGAKKKAKRWFLMALKEGFDLKSLGFYMRCLLPERGY